MLIWNLEFFQTDFSFHLMVILTRIYNQGFINTTNKNKDFNILQSDH